MCREISTGDVAWTGVTGSGLQVVGRDRTHSKLLPISTPRVWMENPGKGLDGLAWRRVRTWEKRFGYGAADSLGDKKFVRTEREIPFQRPYQTGNIDNPFATGPVSSSTTCTPF